MYYLVYESKGTVPYSESDISHILESSRKFNAHNNVTGILFFYRDRFVQYIEGDKEAITFLFNKRISLDKRHKNINLLLQGHIKNRQYKDWNMKYCFMDNFHEGMERVLKTSSADEIIKLIIKIDTEIEAVKL